MGYSVIDSRTEKTSFGLGALKVQTTLTLVKMDEGGFGILYSADYSGMKEGHVTGGPASLPSGNARVVVNASPEVVLIITNYVDSGSTISMHVQVTVAVPVLGTKTIFNNTLGGRYSLSNPWEDLVASFPESLSEDK